MAKVRTVRKNAARTAENIAGNTSKISAGKKTGCYLATAFYGDQNAPQVAALRHYRDEVLLKTIADRVIVKLYYRVSPAIAAWLTSKEIFNATVRMVLDQVAKTNSSSTSGSNVSCERRRPWPSSSSILTSFRI